jgi:hypothetical protein
MEPFPAAGPGPNKRGGRLVPPMGSSLPGFSPREGCAVMKLSTLIKLATLIVVAVALVFGVTYLRIMVGGPSRTDQPGQGNTNFTKAQLKFPELEANRPFQEKPEPKEKPREVEWKQDGHRIFLFENLEDKPVKVGLRGVNCSRCTKVHIAQVPNYTPETKKEQVEADESLRWEEMEDRSDWWFTVPAKGGGAVRLTWNLQRLGPEGIWARLRTETSEAAGSLLELPVPVIAVAPVMVANEASLADGNSANEADLGEMRTEETKPATARFICWSATRKQFSLKVESADHPCITVSTPQRLTDQEAAEVGKTAKKNVLCAYRVEVTVRERNDKGDRMNLGPFRRTILLTSDTGADPVDAVVTGVVRGEVTIGGPNDHDRLDFGGFPSDEARAKDIYLTADTSFPDLEVENAPKYLKVTLEAMPVTGAGRSWRLKGVFRPGELAGEFPRENRMIVLRTKTENPRRINIPATGNATEKVK